MHVDTDPRATPPEHDSPQLPAPPPDEPYYRRGEQARRWGGILLLLGVVWLVFALSSRGPLLGIGFVERSAALAPQSFSAERVVITGAGDNVELVGSDGEAVQVEAVRHGFGWNAGEAEAALGRVDVAMDERGGTLTINVRRPPFAGIGRSPYADLRIALPAGVSAEARVASGDITVSDVSADLTLATVSGRLDASDTAGTLAANTTSGELEIQGHSGPLSAESVSGDIAIEGAVTSPKVKTISGEVRLSGASGEITLSSISGDLSLEASTGATLNIESTSGDVEAELSLAERSSSRISNISGDVSVTLADSANLALDVNTTSGEIETDLGGATAERRSLTANRGDGSTSLTISTTSGDVTVRGG